VRAASRRGLVAASVVTGYAVAAAAMVVALLSTGADPVAVVALGLIAALGLAGLVTRAVAKIYATVDRLADDVELVVDVNPALRLVPSRAGPLARMARAVNRLADQRQSVERGAAAQAAVTRADVESERNRLAALMAQLTVAVVVCNSEGHVLLYNDAARALVGDPSVLGLGRSVFGLVDRGLVAHGRERLAGGGESYTAMTLHGDRLLRVRVAPVRDLGGTAGGATGGTADGTDASAIAAVGRGGFLLVLEDLTREVRAVDERERTFRRLTEATRASLGSIRAAAESMLEFPDLTERERQRFLEVVRDESDRLAGRVDEAASGTGPPVDNRVLDDMAGPDLLAVVHGALERAGVACVVLPSHGAPLWLRADAHAVARTVVHLVSRLRAEGAPEPFTLGLTGTERHAQLDVSWRGSRPAVAHLEGWLEEGLAGGTTTARDVVDRHGAEVWCGSVDERTAYLRILLPLAERAEPGPAVAAGPEVGSRPEFYDFDLFTVREQASDLLEQPLDELVFTVLDTETTGLDPTGGDRIVALGAVRVVNGRILRQETFDRLVDPGRPVPASSTEIHGLTDEMLAGAPAIEEVLTAFVRFAEDTVLVGHNVSFDLQFLQQAGRAAGVDLSRPALDTLLIHAALYPGQEDHTLESIAARLGVSVVGRHTALGDALVTADVLVAMLTPLRQQGIRTLGDALATTRRTYESRVDARLRRGAPTSGR
jgi:DNA polymerase-3 subunit epsilon